MDYDKLQQDNERYDIKYYPNGEDDQDAELVPIRKMTPMEIVEKQMEVIKDAIKKENL